MTICPIAVAVGCRRCPAFALCPLKSVLGDQPPSDSATETAPPKAKRAAKRPTRKT